MLLLLLLLTAAADDKLLLLARDRWRGDFAASVLVSTRITISSVYGCCLFVIVVDVVCCLFGNKSRVSKRNGKTYAISLIKVLSIARWANF